MAIKSLSGNVPPSKAVRALIFSSKTSGLGTRDNEDDDSEEVSKGRFLVGTEDVLDIDEVSKCARKGSLDGKPLPPKTIHMLLMGLQCHVHTAAKHYNQHLHRHGVYQIRKLLYTFGILLVKLNIVICYLVVVMSRGGS